MTQKLFKQCFLHFLVSLNLNLKQNRTMNPVLYSQLVNTVASIEKNLHEAITQIFTKELENLDTMFKNFNNNKKSKFNLQPFTFNHQSNVVHLKETNQAHNTKLLPCKLCPKVYKSIAGLWGHNKTKHVGIHYNCYVCSKQFNRTDHLNRHIKVVHGISTNIVRK